MLYEVEEYITMNGRKPFTEWLSDVRDRVARNKLLARIDRAAHGNFGDWKSLAGAKGLYELREHYGPGYRIYFSIVGQRIVLLLAGSTKRDQDRTITKAKGYLAEYERRTSS